MLKKKFFFVVEFCDFILKSPTVLLVNQNFRFSVNRPEIRSFRFFTFNRAPVPSVFRLFDAVSFQFFGKDTAPKPTVFGG